MLSLPRGVVAAFVDGAVVAPAAELAVREAGLAAAGPGCAVVDLAPARRTITTGDDAAAVADDERPPQRGRDRAGAAADIDRFRPALGDHPGDAGIARQAFERCDREPPGVLGLGPHLRDELAAGPTFQHLDVDHRADVGTIAPAGTVRVAFGTDAAAVRPVRRPAAAVATEDHPRRVPLPWLLRGR